MSRDRNALIGTLAAITGATLFGMLGSLSRLGAEAGVTGVAFTAWRGALGLASLLVLIAARRSVGSSFRAIRALPRGGRLSLAIAATMALTLNASMFTAFGLIPIALALMLFYTYPAGVVVLEIALGHERVTPGRVAALLLSSAGVVLVLAGGLDPAAGAAVNPLGIALGLAAAASQVVFIAVSRSGYESVPADAATAVILASSMVGASVLAAVVGQGGGLMVPFGSLEPWPYLLLAGVVAAGISSLLFLTAIRKIGGTRTGILMLIEPVVGVALAAWLLGEAIAPIQAVGGGLVLLGALVLQVRSEPGREAVVETAAGPVV